MTRSMLDMDTIQIEVTNACRNTCSNCSRFCSRHETPYFMDFNFFKQAIDSMVGYQKMVGFQGGEPLLHPDFERMCVYARSKFPKEQLGLWTTLPKGFEHYRRIICDTFYHIFVNDHSREDIFHHPPLVAIEEVVPDKNKMWQCIDHCWVQEGWSASINPKGAFFCEIAASMSILFNEEGGWPVIPGWWNRIPKDFASQMEQYCPRCGFAVSLHRRKSTDKVDDISPKNLHRLKEVVPKVKLERYKVHDLSMTNKPEPLAAYKDTEYRNRITKRYGMFLYVNEYRFWTPCLYDSFEINTNPQKSMIDVYRERFS